MKKKDFIVKTESQSQTKKAKREYLNEPKTADLMKLSIYFESKVQIPRIKHGNRQTVETLINEALLLAKFLRHKREAWIPRITVPQKGYRAIR